MKKSFKNLLIVSFLFSSLGFGYEALASKTLDDGAKICRCRDEGCRAGNSISFRRVCDDNGGDCTAWTKNC